MSNRLARFLKRIKVFWSVRFWLPLLTRTPVSPGPARQRHGKPTELPRQKDDRSVLPLHSWPLRPFFVLWREIAQQLGIPVEHEVPVEDLRTMFQKAIGILPAKNTNDNFMNCKARLSTESPKEGYQLKRLPQSCWPLCTTRIHGSPFGSPSFGTWHNPIGSGLPPPNHPHQAGSRLTAVG